MGILEVIQMGLLFTLITGLFLLLGMAVIFLTKNNRKIVDFSISMAFGVIVLLIVAELLPESYEMMSQVFSFPQNIVMLIGFVGLGILLLKVLDLFIPDHDTDTKNEASTENLLHIGIVSGIALILHNIIEGMAIYSAVATDTSMGFLMTVGVGLHNIPMGMVVTSTLYQSSTSKKKTILFVFVTALSTFIGGILMFLLSGAISNFVLGILLSVTLGMLIYIVLFELLEQIWHNRNSKITIFGIVAGIIIFLLTLLFE